MKLERKEKGEISVKEIVKERNRFRKIIIERERENDVEDYEKKEIWERERERERERMRVRSQVDDKLSGAAFNADQKVGSSEETKTDAL